MSLTAEQSLFVADLVPTIRSRYSLSSARSDDSYSAALFAACRVVMAKWDTPLLSPEVRERVRAAVQAGEDLNASTDPAIQDFLRYLRKSGRNALIDEDRENAAQRNGCFPLRDDDLDARPDRGPSAAVEYILDKLDELPECDRHFLRLRVLGHSAEEAGRLCGDRSRRTAYRRQKEARERFENLFKKS